MRVEKFLVDQVTKVIDGEKVTKPYSQLSDHYGLSIELIYRPFEDMSVILDTSQVSEYSNRNTHDNKKLESEEDNLL